MAMENKVSENIYMPLLYKLSVVSFDIYASFT
jgi:hypothetical protein